MSFYESSARGIAAGQTRRGLPSLACQLRGGENCFDHLCERLHVRPRTTLTPRSLWSSPSAWACEERRPVM